MSTEISRQCANTSLKFMKACRIETLSKPPYLQQVPSYQDFFENFLLPNKPCVIINNATCQWRSRKEWVASGKPNMVFIRKHFGHVTVPVANCKEEKFSSHCKEDMKLNDYLNYWEMYISKDYPADMKCLYLKDWHFCKQFPDYTAYTTPLYFQSDWLNEFWTERTDLEDDYMFVYMGPKGTWTPFHADVFRSYSWSANICGRKRWLFYPPGQEELLKDVHGNLPFDVESPILHDKSLYPNAGNVVGKLEVIQEEGEVIFVPSGWHHQVFNLEDTISINHNWINGCNVDITWIFLQGTLQDVKLEIEDCKDMDGWTHQCQLILKSCNGMDYGEFYRFILHIATTRIALLSHTQIASTARQKAINSEMETSNLSGCTFCQKKVSENTKSTKSDFLCTFQGTCSCDSETSESNKVQHSIEDVELPTDVDYPSSYNHWIFDLKRIYDVLKLMLGDENFNEIDFKHSSHSHPCDLFQEIGRLLDIDIK